MGLLSALKSDSEKQRLRREKLLARLMESENGLCQSRIRQFCVARAVNSIAAGTYLPPLVIEFCWEPGSPLKRWMSIGLEEGAGAGALSLTKDLVSCLSVKTLQPLRVPALLHLCRSHLI